MGRARGACGADEAGLRNVVPRRLGIPEKLERRDVRETEGPTAILTPGAIRSMGTAWKCARSMKKAHSAIPFLIVA
jgi:hypothetical protein